MTSLSSNKYASIVLICIIALGVFFRFYQITENTFMYYDEGMWLLQGKVLGIVLEHSNASFGEFTQKVFRLSLNTGKALWAFVANMRAYFLDADSYYFTRVISAFFGASTIGVLYLFAKAHFQSKWYALLSCALLAILPTHVYYSRLGLQEGLSTFLFLGGLYSYIYGRHFLFRTLLSGTLWAGVYFSNYRMIVLPLAILIVECCLREKFHWRRFVYSMLTFVSWIFLLGSLYEGGNIKVTFGWMFHQSHLAGGTFSFLNLFSFPYYLVHFESLWFALLFLGGGIFLYKKNYTKAYPLILFLVFTVFFSLSQEKGVRYLTFLLPLMAVGAASTVQYVWELNKNKGRMALYIVLALLVTQQVYADIKIINFKTAHQQAMGDIKQRMPQAKVLSSQAMIQKLFISNPNHVRELRRGIPFLLKHYREGFQFLIIDPQAFVSLTESKKRFDPPLAEYLQFVYKTIPPLETYDHFSKEQLDRFVWEHNENFQASYQFLRRSKEEGLNELKIYDVGHIIYALQKVFVQNEI